MDKVFNQYTTLKKLKIGDFLFSLLRDKKEPIAESKFSAKVKRVFEKVYGISITIRFVRMSWATDLHASNPTQTKVKETTSKMAHSPAEQAEYMKKYRAKQRALKIEIEKSRKHITH